MNLPDSQWIEWYMREHPYCLRDAALRALQSYKEICEKIASQFDAEVKP